jgi:ketosteroid isomerase-like protein
MKHSMKMGFVVIGFAAVIALRAVGAEEANKADHDALRNLRVVFQDAVARNDMERLRPYLATNFSIVTFTDREFTDFDAFKAQWRKTRDAMLGESGSYSVDLDPEYSVLMGNIALCRGNAHNALTDDKGREFKFDAHWSVVCQKQDGQWKIVRGHNSLNPFHNPMLLHGVKSAVIKTATVAFLIGLVAGMVGVFVFRRRRETHVQSSA